MLALALALALATTDSSSAAAQPPLAKAGGAAQTYTFAFQDADLAPVVEEVLGQTLGLSYTIDGGTNAKVSFRVDQRLTKAQLLDAFEAALAANNIALVRDGDRILVTTRARAKSMAGVRPAGATKGVGGYQLVPTQLKSALPSEVAKGLQSMGLAEVVVYADDKTGTLVLGGTSREIQAGQDAINLFDRGAPSASRSRLIELNNSSAAAVADDLKDVLKAGGISGVEVAALDRLNAILVFARTDEALDQATSWVGRLDASTGSAQSSLWVYKPKNVSAETLSVTLNMVLGNSVPEEIGSTARPASSPQGFSQNQATPQRIVSPTTKAASGGGGSGSETRVAVDKDSNSLLISGPPSKRAELQQLLIQLDVLPRQILIEA
ncbi:hypothetical protein BH11PSE2_BH11PSE2_14290 [soil metagenome]